MADSSKGEFVRLSDMLDNSKDHEQGGIKQLPTENARVESDKGMKNLAAEPKQDDLDVLKMLEQQHRLSDTGNTASTMKVTPSTATSTPSQTEDDMDIRKAAKQRHRADAKNASATLKAAPAARKAAVSTNAQPEDEMDMLKIVEQRQRLSSNIAPVPTAATAATTPTTQTRHMESSAPSKEGFLSLSDLMTGGSETQQVQQPTEAQEIEEEKEEEEGAPSGKAGLRVTGKGGALPGAYSAGMGGAVRNEVADYSVLEASASSGMALPTLPTFATSSSTRNQNPDSPPDDPEAGVIVMEPTNEDIIPQMNILAGSDSQNMDDKAVDEKKKWVLYAGGLGVVLLVVIVILCATLIPNSGGNASKTNNHGGEEVIADSAPGSLTTKEYIRSLFPNSTLEAIQRQYSAQSSAYRWLTQDPNLTDENDIITYSDDRIKQRMALATLYYATGGARWHNNTHWMNYTVHECDWYSSLQDKEIMGYSSLREETYNPCDLFDGDNMDRDEHETLGYIRHLHLVSNDLDGTLPPEVFWLTKLQSFELQNNRWLEGTLVGSELTLLTDLRVFGMPASDGKIPEEIWGMTNLIGLQLEISGAIPPETLASFDKLSWLVLSDLTGTIPTELGLLTNLKKLGLVNGDVAGMIPTELGQLSTLKYLDLSQNKIRGKIPTELALLSNLNSLGLDGNKLSGGILSELGLLSALEDLSLGMTQLTSSIPTELGLLTSLQHLYLSKADLSGEIPSELGALSEIQSLACDYNSLKGTIPTQLGLLSYLISFSFGYNALSGNIPTEFGNLANLNTIYLPGNYLDGQIPSELGRMEELHRLDLDNNQLTGQIPSELGRLEELNWLFLQSNQLTGTIPVELEDLVALCLGGNSFTGTIPETDYC